MGRGLRSLGDVTAGMDRRRLPPCDVAGHISALFRLGEGRLQASKSGDCLLLHTSDKTVRCALRGMEPQILSYLAARGHGELRRVRWSAE
jgi:hypothetical protein